MRFGQIPNGSLGESLGTKKPNEPYSRLSGTDRTMKLWYREQVGRREMVHGARGGRGSREHGDKLLGVAEADL